MTHNIEIYGSIHDEPGKGHDRLFIDRAREFAAIFDGAGGDELSETIIQTLPKILLAHGHERTTSPTSFLTSILVDLDNLAAGDWRRATGAMACVDGTGNNLVLTYANAGDSSLYFYDHDKKLERIAHSPAVTVVINGYSVTSTTEFLGNFRTASELAPLIGHLIVPTSMEWTLIGFSDGVQDDDGRGMSSQELSEILGETPPDKVGRVVLTCLQKYDDASIFVMHHSV